MIRLATAADAASVATIQVSGWRAAYAGIMPDAYLAAYTVEKRVPIWSEILKEKTTLIAVHDREPVGFLSTGPSRDEDLSAADCGEIYALYVDPEKWRSGVGTELWRASLDWFRGHDYWQVSLWVLEENRMARDFYERQGFTHDGCTEPYQAGDKSLVEIRYVRAL